MNCKLQTKGMCCLLQEIQHRVCARPAHAPRSTGISRPSACRCGIRSDSTLFVGAAPTMNDLDPEAKTACQWMLGNISNSLYASFADIQSGSLDLSECKVIWWHYHVDGGVDGHDVFAAKATEALAAKNQLREFYENGGSFFLTRYATNLPSFIGVTGDDEWTTPNNC